MQGPGFNPGQGTRRHMPQLKIPCAAPKMWHCQIQKERKIFKIFFIENFVKTKISGIPKVLCLVTMADESELPSPAVTVFAWSSEKHVVLCFPDGKLRVFCWLIPDTFVQPSVV